MTVKMLKKKLGINAIECNWPDDDCSLKDYFKISSTLIIPEGCEKVGYAAFWYCKELIKVVIPESVEEIRSGAFSGCCRATIILGKPKNEFKIGYNAFDYAKDVKEEVRN